MDWRYGPLRTDGSTRPLAVQCIAVPCSSAMRAPCAPLFGRAARQGRCKPNQWHRRRRWTAQIGSALWASVGASAWAVALRFAALCCALLLCVLTSLFQLVVARKLAVGEKSIADTVSLGELGTIRSLLACVTAACMAMAAAAAAAEAGGGVAEGGQQWQRWWWRRRSRV